MDYYTITLIIVVIPLIFASFWHHRHVALKVVRASAAESSRLDMIDNEIHDIDHESTGERYYKFRCKFLWVYGLAMAAEWLQASYLYSCLKNTHKLSEPAIATLFATGFVSAGISALFVESLSNEHGKKFMCQCYCVLYSVSCLTMLAGNVVSLFMGRVIAGLCTALLYSVFESWMTAEYERQGFGDRGTALSTIYSMMAVTNGLVAVGSGIVAQAAVNALGSHTAPFLLSVAENPGTPSKSLITETSWKVTAISLLKDPNTVIMTLTMCFFEGSVYVVLYSWPQAIMSARAHERIWANPPFGTIFSSLMGAMSLGSFIFLHASREANSIQLSSRAVQLASSISASALLLTVILQDESSRFWALCLFEICVGLYYPSMAYLKGRMFREERTGRLHGLLRVPLSIITVLSLSTNLEQE
ncbi:major facilitator superfamily domain-containing protein [Fusarium bulbicola]|nr:major facilitator superfamily domain-containing protein [Fusarium bulbicola]